MKIENVAIVTGVNVKIECAVDGSWVTLESAGEQTTLDIYGPIGGKDELVRCIYRAVPRNIWQTGQGWDTATIDGEVLLEAFKLYEFDFNSIPEITIDISWDSDSERVAA